MMQATTRLNQNTPGLYCGLLTWMFLSLIVLLLDMASLPGSWFAMVARERGLIGSSRSGVRSPRLLDRPGALLFLGSLYEQPHELLMVPDVVERIITRRTAFVVPEPSMKSSYSLACSNIT